MLFTSEEVEVLDIFLASTCSLTFSSRSSYKSSLLEYNCPAMKIRDWNQGFGSIFCPNSDPVPVDISTVPWRLLKSFKYSLSRSKRHITISILAILDAPFIIIRYNLSLFLIYLSNEQKLSAAAAFTDSVQAAAPDSAPSLTGDLFYF